jgi:putative nucleotidyltransferase with HDIG domain
MLVHFLTDEPTKIPAIRAILGPEHDIAPQVLGTVSTSAISDGVLMIDADLRKPAPVEQLKIVLGDLRDVSEKLFVVQKHLHHVVSQAFALGATSVVSRPKEIVTKLAEIEVAQKAAQAAAQAGSAKASPEMTHSAAVFGSMFTAIRDGRPFKLADAEAATSEIINGIERNGLSPWLNDVRRYHEGTFQHCLLVTGIAVGFAMAIKFSAADIKRLGLAATLHDIGKAHIPLHILDKPGRLDPDEEKVMRTHPVIGYDILKAQPEFSEEILDGVRHHHEYLDGTGYPDGLTAPQISDLVRLLTISDIYAALIEARPYRASMPGPAAYKILEGMEGKLEGSLVRAFRKVALAA